MPTYPAYGVDPSTTAFPEATTAGEPMASSSAPRWYAADYHHPLPATGAYVADVPGYATLSGLRRGPESCGSRSRGSGRSSNGSLTRSEIKEALRGATSELVGDLTQEIGANEHQPIWRRLLERHPLLGASALHAKCKRSKREVECLAKQEAKKKMQSLGRKVVLHRRNSELARDQASDEHHR